MDHDKVRSIYTQSSYSIPWRARHELFAQYLSARRILVDQVLPQILVAEPHLTDHGPEHIHNVLENVWKLILPQQGDDAFGPLDYYFLILSIIFHDAGNVFGRNNHQKMIQDIYNYVRPEGHRDRQEQYIILRIVEAHCGEAVDGTGDTLNQLSDHDHYSGEQVKIRSIAALLRFADELAEGRQRTSMFMRKYHNYGESDKYHRYAERTDVGIDRGLERISLTYNFEIKIDQFKNNSIYRQEIKNDLDYIYIRVQKLNQERKYAKFYCELLSPFKETNVSLQFWGDDELLNLQLPSIRLTDLIIPGDEIKKLTDRYSEYESNNIIHKLETALKLTPTLYLEESLCDLMKRKLSQIFGKE